MKIKLVFLLALTVFIVSGIAFTLRKNTENGYPTSLAPSPINTPSISESSNQEDYRTKYYNSTDNFFSGVRYKDIIPDDDNLLSPMACSTSYYVDGNSGLFGSVLNYANILKKNHPENKIYSMMLCSSQNKTIVLYRIGPCGGGCYGRPYVGIFQNDSIRSVEIPNELATYYYGCSLNPLQLTKDNNFYVSCYSGGGSLNANSVYKLNLDSFTLTKIKACTNVEKGEIIPDYKCR